VDTGEVETERFGAFDQGAQIGVTAQQVVDEFTAQRLLAAHQVATGDGVTLGQGRNGVVDDLQHGRRCGPYGLSIAAADDLGKVLPEPAGGGQVELHHPAGGDALLGGSSAERFHGVQFSTFGLTPGDGGVGQQRQVVAEQRNRHAAGVAARPGGDGDEPLLVGVGHHRPLVAARFVVRHVRPFV
jgi:hypothetical protein